MEKKIMKRTDLLTQIYKGVIPVTGITWQTTEGSSVDENDSVIPSFYVIPKELFDLLGDFLESQEMQHVSYAELLTFGRSLCSVN